MKIQSSNTVAIAIVFHAIVLTAAVLFLAFQIKQYLALQPTQNAALHNAQPLNKPAKPTSTFDQSKLRTNLDGDYVYGKRDAQVNLFVYTDFECPYCTRFYPVAKELVDSSNGKVNMIIRLYPLDFHVHAIPLANEALCVAEQKGDTGFYKYADNVFGLKGQFSDPATGALLASTKNGLNLDTAKFSACIKQNKFDKLIAKSIDEGKAIGVAGTPSSVLYDTKNKKAKFEGGAKDINAMRADLQELTQ